MAVLRFLLLAVLLSQAGLIEPAGGGAGQSSSPKRGERRREGRRSESRPEPQAVPQPAPSGGGGGLIVPGNPAAPAPSHYSYPRRHWRRNRGYWYDPGPGYWYYQHHGHWWRHDPAREIWIIERDGYSAPASYSEPSAPAGGSWKNGDGTRLAEVNSIGEAFLYDASSSPPRLLKYLGGLAAAARWSGDTLLLDMRDGTFHLFGKDGEPLGAPTSKPPANP